MSKMNNEKRKPGGDKVISRLRVIGDTLEGTVIGLLSVTAVTVVLTLGVRLATDSRVYFNKRKMKGGKSNV